MATRIREKAIARKENADKRPRATARYVRIGKAGRTRHMGIRPAVRGVVMNPCDHPHGGGEGKSPVGMPAPVTPWGKPALGLKTRKHKKYSNRLIVKRAGKK